jgi:serine protease Do
VNRKPAGDASQFTSAVHAAPADKDILFLVWSRGNASYRTVHPDPSVAQSDNNQ